MKKEIALMALTALTLAVVQQPCVLPTTTTTENIEITEWKIETIEMIGSIVTTAIATTNGITESFAPPINITGRNIMTSIRGNLMKLKPDGMVCIKMAMLLVSKSKDFTTGTKGPSNISV